MQGVRTVRLTARLVGSWQPRRWNRRRAPLVTGSMMTTSERERYARHVILPGFGEEGQRRLREASVLVIGAGGLGSPLTMYLAAAGIGRLGLVDFDDVDLSNLQRQLLHGTSDVGRSKLESARDRLHDINPHVALDLHAERLSAENATRLVEGYDVVADGTDNFPTRYLVNDVSVLTGVPNVYASIYRFEGQVSVFGAAIGDSRSAPAPAPARGPCYRCLFPEPPPPDTVPSCADGGVLGVLPGIVGSLQALEVIKLITGIGSPLVGRLLLIETLGTQFRELAVDRDPACPVCGDAPTILEPVDYDAFCGLPSSNDNQPRSTMNHMTVRELKKRLDAGNGPLVVDVRQPDEYQLANIGGRLLPLNELSGRIHELEAFKDQDVVLMCRSGVRSASAFAILKQNGFSRLYNLDGGILAWSREIDSSVPTY